MVYYKIPIVDGVFDYPAGCLLCCAYPYGNYMYCKFESVTAVGSDWINITESEFDVRCPDFPLPEDAAAEAESAEYPGCRYRMVDGEQEWYNPPMVFGQTYRTTERFNGKPVYAALMEFYISVIDGTSSVDISGILDTGAKVIHISGIDAGSYGFTPINTNDHAYYVDSDRKLFVVERISGDPHAEGWALLKFVKPED